MNSKYKSVYGPVQTVTAHRTESCLKQGKPLGIYPCYKLHRDVLPTKPMQRVCFLAVLLPKYVFSHTDSQNQQP